MTRLLLLRPGAMRDLWLRGSMILLFTILWQSYLHAQCQNYTVTNRGTYQVCFDGVTYDYVNNTSTYTYTYSVVSGAGLSHIVFTGCFLDNYISGSATGGCSGSNVVVGKDASSGNTYGVKFNCSLSAGDPAITVSFTLNGIYTTTTGSGTGSENLVIRTGGQGGGDAAAFHIPGPSCIPLGDNCEKANYYLQHFNVITFGNYSTNSEYNYNAFVGGDFFNSNSFTSGNQLNSSVFPYPTQRSLEVVGKMGSGNPVNLKYSAAFGTSNTISGNQVSNSYGTRTFNINTTDAKLAIDGLLASRAADMQTALEATSLDLSGAATTNGSSTSGNLTFNVSNYNNGFAVFNINSIPTNATISLNNAANVGTIIINVAGTNVSWPSSSNFDGSWIGSEGKVIWNFYQATTLNLPINLRGALLAPKADLTHSAQIDGVVVAKSITSTSEIHKPYFSGNLCINYDYGDLPDISSGTAQGDYQTLLANNGPRHKINSKLKIGSTIDSESNGQQSTTANGDDNNGTDDEDGVTFPTFIAGQNATVTVSLMNTMGSNANLYGFIDWNNDGDFNDTSEAPTSVIVANNATSANITFSVPSNAVSGVNLGARFRLTTDNLGSGGTASVGAASNGEVEDYVVQVVAYDYGDLPDLTASTATGDYQTLLANNGPRHQINASIRIGATVDGESDGFQSTLANGDDNNNTDDEDGVTFPTLIAGQTASIPVSVYNNTGSTATLYGWIDFNNDGLFDNATERFSVTVPTGTNGTVNLSVTVPSTTTINTNVGARFRLSTDAAAANSTGSAINGEVEDYVVQVVAYDFGDLPDLTSSATTGDYQTLLANNGSRHQINANIRIGATVDGESDGFQSTLANGDDNNSTDDEDGVTFPTFIAGQNAMVTVSLLNTTGNNAKLYGFIDWNNDGDFDDTGEAPIPVIVANNATSANITFNVPSNAVLGVNIGARFRLTTDNLSSGGAAALGLASNGEVEDYLVQVIAYDRGDLPDLTAGTGTGDYQTLAANNGPQHQINPNIRIGATIDGETDGLQSTTANGDDNNNTGSADDEDGVTFPTLIAGQIVNIPVSVYNNTGSTATLYGWIDFNNDGAFDNAMERFVVTVPSGTNGTVNLSVTVPSTATINTNVGARFRLSTDASAANSTGSANDGEVEDYVVQIIAYDYGDLPDLTAGTGTGDYQTLAANGGPRHQVSPNLKIGTSVDGEADAFQSTDANGDDNNGTDDEDGVTFPTFIAGRTATVTVSLTNTTGGNANLYGFIDWNNDGDFDDTGEAPTVVIVPNNATNATITFNVPADAVQGVNLGARFRLTTDDLGSGGAASVGTANNGEVEDYVVTVAYCDINLSGLNISMCNSGNMTFTFTASWSNAPATGNFEAILNESGIPQAITRTNFDASGSQTINITVPCSTTIYKIEVRFANSTGCSALAIFPGNPIDPLGHIYCTATGELITGGTITVTPPMGGSVDVFSNGSTGSYGFYTNGVVGIYTIAYTPPPGYTMTGTPGVRTGDTNDILEPDSNSEDNPLGANPLILGSGDGNNDGFLDNPALSANPFFFQIMITNGTPAILNNNIPVICPRTDFGDLPSNYPTATANVGPDVNNDGKPESNPDNAAAPAVWAGSIVDVEISPRFSSDANGDDITNTSNAMDDEDGLTLPNPQGGLLTGHTYNYFISTNSNGNDVTRYYGLWFDWDGNGTFDQFYSGSVVPTMAQPSGAITTTVAVTIPSNAVSAYATRLVVSSNTVGNTPDGTFSNAEVEDYIATTVTPIELINFDAYLTKDQQVLLKWRTASEKNNAYFSIQRSRDGVKWQEIGQQKGAGNSETILAYDYLDLQPLPGISYYRLQQFDVDGKSSFSPIRVVTLQGKNGAAWLYPNPTNDLLYVQLSGNDANEEQRIEVFNITGQQIKTGISIAQKGTLYTIDTQGLTPGTYFLRVMDKTGANVQILRFIRQ